MKQTTRNMAQHLSLPLTHTLSCTSIQLHQGFSPLFAAVPPTFTADPTEFATVSAHVLWIAGVLALLSVILAVQLFRYRNIHLIACLHVYISCCTSNI